MANFRVLARCFPAALDYPGVRKWIRRGDVLSYAPGIATAAVSTDALGFRHTRFDGRDFGVADLPGLPKAGLLFGSSHVFGYGLAANAETLASRLSEHVGFPVLNVSLPEADSRTLHTIFTRLLQSFAPRIAFALVLSGGDFTRFCFTSRADPLFGPPALPLQPLTTPRRDPEAQIGNLLQFVGFWARGFSAAAAQARIRLAFADDVTYFEKSEPDEIERRCALGASSAASQQARFDAHAAFYPQYAEHRRRLAADRGVPLLDFPPADELRFIDEYHYRAETQSLIARRLAPSLA